LALVETLVCSYWEVDEGRSPSLFFIPLSFAKERGIQGVRFLTLI